MPYKPDWSRVIVGFLMVAVTYCTLAVIANALHP